MVLGFSGMKKWLIAFRKSSKNVPDVAFHTASSMNFSEILFDFFSHVALF